MNNKPRLGWIGTGVMGHSMAGHLLAAGYPLTVYSRTKAKAEGLLACGARWAETPREVARNADIVFSIVGYPRDVEDVMLGEQGALSGLDGGGILCDMTTSSPELARRIAAAAAARGCASLDAPVTGGDIGAREARLSIFVGGDKEAFERVRPCFEAMGKNILHCGAAGTGQQAKLANQVAIAGVMFSVCESLLFAQEAGLNVRQWLELVVPGAAGSTAMGTLGRRLLGCDYAPRLLCGTLHQGSGPVPGGMQAHGAGAARCRAGGAGLPSGPGPGTRQGRYAGPAAGTCRTVRQTVAGPRLSAVPDASS